MELTLAELSHSFTKLVPDIVKQVEKYLQTDVLLVIVYVKQPQSNNWQLDYEIVADDQIILNGKKVSKIQWLDKFTPVNVRDYLLVVDNLTDVVELACEKCLDSIVQLRRYDVAVNIAEQMNTIYKLPASDSLPKDFKPRLQAVVDSTMFELHPIVRTLDYEALDALYFANTVRGDS